MPTLLHPLGTHASNRAAGSSRAPRVPFALLVLGLLVGGMVLLLGLNTASAANELQRRALITKDNAVAASVQDLKVRAANSAAPGNLARAANELGMVPAGNPAFVVIGKDGKATVVGKPKAATDAPVPAPTTSKPKPSATPTAPSAAVPAGTPKPSPTGTAKVTAGPTANPSAAPTSPTAPSITPTPTVTLPGGTR